MSSRPSPRTSLASASLVLVSFALLAGLPACGDDDDAPPPPPPDGPTSAIVDLDVALDAPGTFYDFPFPSDLRLTAAGTPDLRGVPVSERSRIIEGLVAVAGEHPGFPVVPVGYMRFDGDLAPRAPDDVIPAASASPILLVDIDPDSPDRGALVPVVAATLPKDAYTPDGLLGVAARPGFVLHAERTYAFVVTTGLLDAAGEPVAPAPAFASLARGETPPGARGAALRTLTAPLFETLATLGVPAATVATATVFTTGDVVAELAELSDDALARFDATIADLAVDPDDGAAHPRYCELRGTVTFPQFQAGEAPFDTGGLFVRDAMGALVEQRRESMPITVSLPLGEMPAAGFPLTMYFHGSGGLSTASADRGTWRLETDATRCPEGTLGEWEGRTGCNTQGEGPAHVLARHGIAMASSALPVNPERVPGASEQEYLNFNNLGPGRDLFRQGVIEQRLFLEALLALRIAPETVAACAGLTLPAGATEFRFDGGHVYAQGQSMGGQYTNLFSAVEPRVLAALPTGAGGYWSQFILETPLFPNPGALIGTFLIGTSAPLSFLHPALQIYETAWEAVDPIVYIPRLARRPLPGHPVRDVYEPVGLGDSYFATPTFDAIALAYGHEQAGEIVWPEMQEALALAGLDGLVSYPVADNVMSETGAPFTGVVVQYEGDGLYDPHAIYTQLDAVKHQYGCFLATHFATGTARVLAPGAETDPCD
jgi:hypothetical protein